MKKKEISVLNVLFCLMVIFIHVTAAPITGHNTTENVSKILFFIHRMCGAAVHGFVFLSGMKLFLKNTDKIDYRKYLKLRFRRIYVPYLIFTVLYYLFEVSRDFYVFNLKQLFGFLVFGTGEAHLYFIFVIMQFYILFPLWRHLLKIKNVPLLLGGALVLNFVCYCHLPQILYALKITTGFTYNHGLFTSYIFAWILGCVCGKYYKKVSEFLSSNFLKFGIAAAILLIMDVYMAYNTSYNFGNYPIMNYVRLLYLYAMILFLFGKFANYVPSVFRTEMFEKINNATFSIYFFHVFVICAVDSFTKSVFSLGQLEIYLVNFVLVYSISVTLCVMFKNYLGRIKNEKE